MEDLYCWQSKFKSCYYSNKLINKIILLNKNTNNKVDLNEVKKAIYYAKKYHASQRRLSGEPYYTHPLIIAEMVIEHIFTTEIIVTSILHDTIEDTNLTKDMIAYIFNLNIATKVADLTRIQNDIKISSAKLLESLWLQKKEDLLIIKFFDRLHNMQTIQAQSPEKKLSITKETFEKFISLSMH